MFKHVLDNMSVRVGNVSFANKQCIAIDNNSASENNGSHHIANHASSVGGQYNSLFAECPSLIKVTRYCRAAKHVHKENTIK